MRRHTNTSESLASVPDDEHERDEWILKEMYVPLPALDKPAGEQDLVDLVFVHGLGGNLRGTWKQEGTHEPWFTKREFLGPLQDSVRALSFGYNANRFEGVANTRIIHHANDLLRNLVLKRLDCPDRPVIFIAHSLGGLIVKRAILLCATNNNWSAIKTSTKSIIFMGTPHLGSEQAENLVVVQKLASLMKFQAPIATHLSKELKTFSTAVQDINMEFTIDVHRSMELLCCYESHPQRLPSGSKEIIVPQWSAVLQGVDNIDLNCTHSALPKFATPTEPRFELFWGEVQRLVRKANPPPLRLIHAPTSWVDEEVGQTAPARSQQQLAPPRRRIEVVSKSPKPSRASLIRSSANEIIAEVRNRIIVHKVPEPEGTASEMKTREEPLEDINPRDLENFLRLLRQITPENQGLDREQPHWKTCKWIATDPLFTDWMEDGGLLFITGNPGCGKSHLAKYIQGMLENREEEDPEEKQTLVVSFYCDSLESSRAEPPILDLVVKAILGRQKGLFRSVHQKILTVLDTEVKIRFNHLMEVLHTLVTDSRGIPTCLIIDGLDQCADEFVLKFLRGLDTIFRRDNSSSTLRIVITSRLTDSIRGFALNNHHLNMTSEMVGEDIQHVVDEEVDRIIKARQIASIGRDSVSAVIVERANGSFLFASSVLKELWHIKDTGANSVFTLLTSCPSTMEAIYQQDMSRLETERIDLFKLIQFMCIARRALQIDEARDILHLENPDITTTYDVVGDLTRLCPRLVKYGAEGTIELLHQTLYDFIINTYDVDAIHGALGDNCLRYLKAVDWVEALATHQVPIVDSRDSLIELVDVQPLAFLDYAASWMGYHFRSAHEAGKVSAWDIWDFFCSEEGNKWQQYCLPKKRNRRSSSTSSSVLSRRPSVSMSVDSNYSRSALSPEPLNLAVSDDEDDEDDEEAKPVDEDDDEWETSESSASSMYIGPPPPRILLKPPLVLLAQWDVDAVIRELFFEALESSPRQILSRVLGMVPFLPSRSPVKTQKEFRAMVNNIWEETTAVHYAAAQSGRVLELLLPFMDDINQTDDDGATLLMLAAASNESKGVEALLAAGVEVNPVDRWNQTALYSALHTNNTGVIKMLLEHGADPDIRSGSGHSPLEVAIGQNNSEHAELILKFNPDVTMPMTTGQPPVFLANRLAAYAVIEQLLPHINVDQIWDGERLIHNVTWRGLEDVVKKLISLGANLNDPPVDTPKATPVALAAETDNNVILKALLTGGASAECPVRGLSAALHIAASRGYVEGCRLLVEHGCNIDAPSERDQTALYIATDKQQVGVVELLVAHGADPGLPRYEPPLLAAADVGNLEMMKIILSGRRAPEVDARGSQDDTALGVAATFGDVNMVSVLLDHGADPNRRSGTRMSNKPLQLAIIGKHAEAAIELLKRGASPLPNRKAEHSPFHVACFEGLVDVIEVLFEVISPSEVLDMEWGWFGTPLLQAATGGHGNVVQLLIDRGADPNYKLTCKSSKGKTILHAAAGGGSVEALDIILGVIKDPDLEARDERGRSALACACWRGREDMVKHLLEKGAKTDVTTESGESMVIAAVEGGSLKVLEMILEADPGLDVDSPIDDGRTPLILAAPQEKPDLTEALLKRGAAINRRCKNGYFALSQAIKYRRRENLKVLLERDDLDLMQLDPFGRNALQIAQACGTSEMPGMIVTAARTAEIETKLMEHRDMFGMNTYDYARIDRTDKLPWKLVINGIRGNAQDLVDNFAMRGHQWERLGKFLLQAECKSFAQIAFWRSVDLVETTPIYLEHMVPCRLCLDTISTNRWTCMTCCNADLCHHCMGRYGSLGNRMRTCQDHEFFRVDFPRRVDPEVSSSKGGSSSSSDSLKSSDSSVDLRRALSPIQEEFDYETIKSDNGDEEGEGKEGSEREDSDEDEDDDSKASIVGSPSAPNASPIENGENDDVIGGPSAPRSVDLSGDKDSVSNDGHADANLILETDLVLKRGGELDDDDDNSLVYSTSDDDYTERTEEELRQFLEAVLHAFPENGKAEKCRRWRFWPKRWLAVYRTPTHEPAAIMPAFEPPVEDKFNRLASIPYMIIKDDLALVLTGLPFRTYHERARRRFAGVRDEGAVADEGKGRNRRDEFRGHAERRRHLNKRESSSRTTDEDYV